MYDDDKALRERNCELGLLLLLTGICRQYVVDCAVVVGSL